MSRKRKPDLLMVLFIAIGLGVVVTGYAFDMGSSPRNIPAVTISSK
jgi:hypothetical protein